eukprot:6217-Chlamydomonas_euryale.AAC.1
MDASVSMPTHTERARGYLADSAIAWAGRRQHQLVCDANTARTCGCSKHRRARAGVMQPERCDAARKGQGGIAIVDTGVHVRV